MTGSQTSHSSGEIDLQYDGMDRLIDAHFSIMQALDARKKFAHLVEHKAASSESASKLNTTIISMVDKLGKDLAEVPFKKGEYENGEIIDMIYRSVCLLETLSDLEGFAAITEGLSNFLDRLVEELAATHQDKKY